MDVACHAQKEWLECGKFEARMNAPAEHNFGSTEPPSPQRGRMEHIWILGLSLVAIAASHILDLSPEGAVIFRSNHFGFHVELPETCMSHRIFGISCPGCGLTRSFVAFAHGNIRLAIETNVMGPILFIICWLQIPYRIFRYFGHGLPCKGKSRLSRVGDLIIWTLLIGLILTWTLKLAVEIIS